MNRASFVRRPSILALLALAGPVWAQTPVGTAFTYQGRLVDNGTPANGPYDLGFSLYAAPSGGAPLGSTTLPAVQVSQGLFSVKLDFGVPPFTAGQARWLEIQVSPPGGPTLSPRQELTPSPYTLFSSYTDPANLTSLNAGNLTSGTVPDARVAGAYTQPLSLTNPANALAGNGAAVTSLNASNLASGTVPSGVVSGTYSNALTFSSPGNFFTGDGSGLTNLNAQPKYVRTVVVSPVGTAAANGTALLNALAGITTASAANPWLLKIEPGIYDVGTTSFVMKPFVDVEGSGETATRITGTGHATNDIGTVQAVTNSELRFVTVESTGGTYAKALYVSNASPRIGHVTVLASGASLESQGLYSDAGAVPIVSDLTAFAAAPSGGNSLGVLDVGSSSQLFHVTSNSSGGNFSRAYFVCCGGTPIIRNLVGVATDGVTENQGVAIYGASPTLEYVTGIATGAAMNNLGVLVTGASTPVLRQVACRAIGATNFNWGCLSNGGAQPTMSEITADAIGGTFARGLEDDALGAGASLSHVRAAASGGSSESRGLKINNCSPRVVDLEAFANGSGSSTVYGVHLVASSSDVSHVTATAGGDSTGLTIGVRMEGAAAAPTLSHATAFGGGGGQSYGLVNQATGEPSVRDSVLSAAGTGSISAGFYSSQPINLVNVTTRTSGTQFNYGGYISNPPAPPRLVNVRLVGSGGTGGYGLLVDGAGTVNVDRSTLAGDVNSIFLFNTATVRVAVSQLVSPVLPGGGTLSCLGSYNGAYNLLNAACQ